MVRNEDIPAIVERALNKGGLPSKVEDLDSPTRKMVERIAFAQGTTAQEILDVARAVSDDKLAEAGAGFNAAEIAAAARNR